MVALACFACQDVETMVPFRLNRSGTRRFRCKACGKTFTPQGHTRRLSDEKHESIEGALAERISQRGIVRALGASRNTIRAVRRKGRAGRRAGAAQLYDPPEGDVVEMDENGHARVTACVRFSPALWLRSCSHEPDGSLSLGRAGERASPLALAFAVSDRSDIALGRLLDEEMPLGWRESHVKTDGREAYQRLLPDALHEVCSNQSGKTSINEHRGSAELQVAAVGAGSPLLRRLLILAERHNDQRIRRWRRTQASRLAATQSDPSPSS